MNDNLNTIEKRSAQSDQKQTSHQNKQRNWGRCAVLALVGIAAALVTGCSPGKYTGGGFIQSAADGNGKATFGFELEGIDTTGSGQVTVEFVQLDPNVTAHWGVAKGQCTYNDHAAGVQFHIDCEEETNFPADAANLSGVLVTANADFTAPAAYFFGPYKSPAGNGTANVTITCTTDQYGNTNDTLTVELFGGPYDGYYNYGTIQGGNIQFHPANSQ